MHICRTCIEKGKESPAAVESDDAAIEAEWFMRADGDRKIWWECPECVEDPWAPHHDIGVVTAAFGLQNRSKRSQQKAELQLALMWVELGGRVREGPNSILYSGVSKHHGRIAVKVMNRNPFARPQEMIRFEREVAALEDLEHPRIVKLLEHGVLTSRMFLATEWVGAHTLADAVVAMGGKLPTGWALRAFDQVCEALEHAHAHEIIHRDVKPSNVFLDDHTGDAILGDFGLCRPIMIPMGKVSATMTGDVVGTGPYMAPEMRRGRPAPDPRLDVYACGRMLCVLLTGAHPRPELAGVPRSLRSIVREALAHEPADRIATIAELRARVRASRAFWRGRIPGGWRKVAAALAAGRGRTPPG